MANTPNYEQFTSLDEIDMELDKHKTELHRIVKLMEATKVAKKEMAASYNETLKELKEKLEEEMGVIDAFQMQRKAYHP